MKIAKHLLASAAIVAVAGLGLGAQAQVKEVEVVHWWTSGGEAAASRRASQGLRRPRAITWKDMPVAGGGGDRRP